ncbi:hypothetical protein [Streptomyces sp. TLI_55]|uniref:hypothetical protein n=1 Tax=Streptomyces sp. TLI_55 TaxID=1938861 RepID=UPI00211CB20B|nr:hypothetical protein [Streptomyces sp. TLI_55]
MVVLFSAGCSGGDDTSAYGDATPSATTEVTESPTPSPTPPYPTDASGCHDNKGWTTAESVDWVRLDVDTPQQNSGSDGLEFSSIPGYLGPLCHKITVQVEFWKLLYGVADGDRGGKLSDGTRPDYYFDIRRVKRVEVRADADGERTIALPKSLYAKDRSPCVGALLTVTVGKPLKSKELPKEVDVGGTQDIWDRKEVKFRSERVADYELSEPSAPQVCSPDGRPTADPADVPPPSAEPTDLFPTDLYPSPSYSWDLSDILRSPTP